MLSLSVLLHLDFLLLLGNIETLSLICLIVKHDMMKTLKYVNL